MSENKTWVKSHIHYLIEIQDRYQTDVTNLEFIIGRTNGLLDGTRITLMNTTEPFVRIDLIKRIDELNKEYQRQSKVLRRKKAELPKITSDLKYLENILLDAEIEQYSLKQIKRKMFFKEYRIDSLVTSF